MKKSRFFVIVFHFLISLMKNIQGEQLEETPCNLYKYQPKNQNEAKKYNETYILDCSHCGLTELPEIKRVTDDITEM